MKVTVFTSDQPRHIALINGLADTADEVYAVVEAKKTPVVSAAGQPVQSHLMKTYFSAVTAAEQSVFGCQPVVSGDVHAKMLYAGELASMDMDNLDGFLNSDVYVVFGSSFIKSPLVDFLISRRTYNIHMGTSPYYRGSACNFWACYDKKYDYVGATIHLLSKGLDSGGMLFHAFPPAIPDVFLLGMLAVKSAQHGFLEYLRNGEIANLEPIRQDKAQEIRYTRSADFNEIVLRSYMQAFPSGNDVLRAIQGREMSRFVRPYRMADRERQCAGQKARS